MKKILSLVLFSCIVLVSSAQNRKTLAETPYTTAKERAAGFEKRKLLYEQSMVNGISFRSVGPTVMSGRVTDLEVDPNDPTHFYVAYASGGLWETTNNGTTFTPIFDHEYVMTIGDIAVDWKNNILYVGSGENNSSRSSYAGYGVFKSENNGKNWSHIGLEESHHVSRIILHPTDKNIFWVAVIGHLFTPNKERGLYKTSDGGKTWKQTLFINENTGIIDLVVDEKNPNVLYASAWHRERRSWNFVESGNGSGIYKSTDGGEKWENITNGTNGFPVGEGTGRIGLALCKNKPETIYALLDNQNRRPEEKTESTDDALTKAQLKKMTKDEFLKLDEKKIKTFLRSNGFPKKITSDLVIKKIKNGTILPSALAEYLEDANALLFDTPVTGAEVYRSDDGGKNWKKTHEKYMDDIVYSYGYYFGQIRVDDVNPEKIYLAAFVIATSEDGGKTFKSINGDNVHVDHHALWVNPKRKGHLINGNDGGLNISYDDGKSWIRCNNPAVGQFYTVNVDNETPYNVYGGLQDNGVWYGPSTYVAGSGWQMEGKYPYQSILGGDGMQVQIDPQNSDVVYTGFQFGNYFRINKKTGENVYLTPKHELGERPLRWNWQSPILISSHGGDIVYFAANKVFRSLKRGEDFVAISDDLTKGGKTGDVAFGTITSIHESPLKFGVIYAGTDDGNIWVTKNGGNQWTNIVGTLPADFWVRKIQASAHSESRVYVCLNGHTRDVFASMVYLSDDYGKTWKQIGTDLPVESVNVIREDPENENLIYIGTDHGVYISLNRGTTFMAMMGNLPRVPVHDMVIQQRDHDLVIGTHGRSIYIASVKELQQLHDSIVKKQMHLFAMDAVMVSKHWGSKPDYWSEFSVPEIKIPVWVNSKKEENVSVEIKDKGNAVIYSSDMKSVPGLNYLSYHLDLSISQSKDSNYHKGENEKYYLVEGEYLVVLKWGANTVSGKLEVKKPE